MRIRHGFDPRDREEVARLYWAAFGDKLGRILGPEPRALRYVARILRADHAISAYSPEGRLMGVVGFHTRLGTLAGGTPADIVAVYGLPGAIWRCACLRALVQPVPARQLMIDGLFVTEADRERGVGTALIEALAREALARGYSELRLEVVESNPRARALYERRGFAAVQERRLRALRPVFGFSTAAVMVRRLS